MKVWLVQIHWTCFLSISSAPFLFFSSHSLSSLLFLLPLFLLLLKSGSLQRWDELCPQLFHWPPPSAVWSRQQTPKAVMTTEQMMIITARLKTSHSSSSSQFHFPPLFLISFALHSPSILIPNMFMAIKQKGQTPLGPAGLPLAKISSSVVEQAYTRMHMKTEKRT